MNNTRPSITNKSARLNTSLSLCRLPPTRHATHKQTHAHTHTHTHHSTCNTYTKACVSCATCREMCIHTPNLSNTGNHDRGPTTPDKTQTNQNTNDDNYSVTKTCTWTWYLCQHSLHEVCFGNPLWTARASWRKRSMYSLNSSPTPMQSAYRAHTTQYKRRKRQQQGTAGTNRGQDTS